MSVTITISGQQVSVCDAMLQELYPWIDNKISHTKSLCGSSNGYYKYVLKHNKTSTTKFINFICIDMSIKYLELDI
jgi:hypothetical protein